jgi:glycerol dehydrogenase-like iron-containing ADH family enzyme
MLPDMDDIAGLGDLIAQLSAAARREGSAMVIGEPTPPELAAATDALAKRVMRRVRRIEHLSRMGGIEPTDVRGALIGIWRN